MALKHAPQVPCPPLETAEPPYQDPQTVAGPPYSGLAESHTGALDTSVDQQAAISNAMPNDEEAALEHPTANAFGPAVGQVAANIASPSAAVLHPAQSCSVQCGPPSRSRDSSTEKSGATVQEEPQRMPPQLPVLQPYYRWCSRCERVKTYRAQ